MAHRTTWESSTTAAGSIDVVTSTTTGDTLVACVVNDSGVDTTITWPSGFVEQHEAITTADGQHTAFAIKVNASGSEGTLTFSTAGNAIIAIVSAFSGRDTTTQPDVTSVEVVEDANENPPTTDGTIVPTTDGCDIVAIYAVDTGGATNTTTFSGGGLSWATHADHTDTTTFRNISIGSAPQTTAASITVTATGTQNAGKILFLAALRPSGGGGGGGTLWAQSLM